MPDIASSILGLHGWAALAVVFALPALESSAFVGIIFPGEIAVVLGGVLAFNHRVSLVAVMIAAVLGAIVGDSVGYAVGRRWGNRLLEGPLSRVIPANHADRAKRFLARRGGRAVFFGRFTAALRVMVPGLAGMSGVPYGRFFVSNVAGGTVWGVTFVLLGYAAGESWRRVEKTARNASLLLFGAVVVVAIAVAISRWVSHHPEQVRARLRWLGRIPGVRWAYHRFERQLAWLARRVRPSAALGLSLTVGFVATLLIGTGFAVLAIKVAGSDLQRNLDQPVLDWLVGHRSPGITTAMKAITVLASWQAAVVVVAVAGLAFWLLPARRSIRSLLLLAVCSAGAAGLSEVIKRVIGRPRPPVSVRLVAVIGYAFPSGHATQAMALYGCLAALTAASSSRWRDKATEWTAALLLIAAIGFSRLYLGSHWMTDVVGGFALGAVWLGLVLMVVRAVAELRARGSTAGSAAGVSYPPGRIPVAPRK